MTKFKVEVIETSSKTVEIETDSSEIALKEAKLMWRNEEIVLDSDDFVEVKLLITKADENT